MSMSDIRYRVREERESPPGGWRWRHPVSGTVATGDDLSTMAQKVRITLMNLGEDPAEAEDQIHDETARHLRETGREDLTQIFATVNRTAMQYASGAKAAFLKWWKESPVFGMIRGKSQRGEPVFVDQEEGDRRSAICINCPHNVIPAGKGWLQNWTDGQMLQSVEGRKVASHEKLGVCDVCSCELRAAVWWSPDIIAATTKGAKFARNLPDHCWKQAIIRSPIAG